MAFHFSGQHHAVELSQLGSDSSNGFPQDGGVAPRSWNGLVEFLGQMVMPKNASKLLAFGLREGPKVCTRTLMGAETGRGATSPNHVEHFVPVKPTGQGRR